LEAVVKRVISILLFIAVTAILVGAVGFTLLYLKANVIDPHFGDEIPEYLQFIVLLVSTLTVGLPLIFFKGWYDKINDEDQ
jgi:hypothetical protein